MFITDSIHYIGVDDASASMFEAQYPLYHGMSYNSYVIRDKKTAILDTTDRSCAAQWMRNLEFALAGTEPDYLVVHHLEPDHSSMMEAVMTRYPGMKLVLSARACAMLPQFLSYPVLAERVMAVKDGDTLELGHHTLQFIMAPMIHWPEVMMSYESHEQILFSADAFGKFGVLSYHDDWVNEARRYYINIVGKYGRQVSSLLTRLDSVPVHRIASLHGPLLEGNLTKYLRLYSLWSSYRAETEGVLVAYASIYGNTEKAALQAADILRNRMGVKNVTVMNLCRCDMSEAVAQAFRLSGMLLAAPTYDGALFPAMEQFLNKLSMKGYRSRRVGLMENGSWAPLAGKIMRNKVTEFPDVDIVEPCVTIRTTLNDASQKQLTELCRALSDGM
ncbi:MAG: FprA family A-type flavoprotein [Muribaculaceae bacterium]|nr:FprA family A-type flavoprotein [Muribaculaceae bacterium]